MGKLSSISSKMLSPWVAENTISTVQRGGAGLAGGFIGAKEGLRSPNRGPVLVDELRFTRSSGSNPIPLDLRVTVSIGDQVLADDVPLDLLCKPLDFNLFKSSALSRVWNFAKPLYIPPNTAIAIKARLLDVFSGETASFDLNVAMAGRTLPDNYPVPDVIDYPFASHWTITGTASGTAQSTPNDLRNKTQRPLDVERFAALAAVNSAVDDLGAALQAKVQLYGENATLGVRDQTPLGVLAFYGRLAWMARSKLPAGGFYTVDLDYTLPTGEAGPFTFGIAMIGSYPVPTR